MLHMEHLTKDYGNGQGIFDICLDCEKGQIIGLVGSNGSGKTTLIKNDFAASALSGGNDTVEGTGNQGYL